MSEGLDERKFNAESVRSDRDFELERRKYLLERSKYRLSIVTSILVPVVIAGWTIARYVIDDNIQVLTRRADIAKTLAAAKNCAEWNQIVTDYKLMFPGDTGIAVLTSDQCNLK